MLAPSFADSMQVLLLQAADNGRGPILFGDCIKRVSSEVVPFMVGEQFPSVYLECPLIGDPFLDITLLYSELKPGTRVQHPAVGDANAMLEWFETVCGEYPAICCGFELDVKEPQLPAAAVHFQPRASLELVRPFCEAVGEPKRADLYLNLAARMPEGWDLSFFGMFRGRPGSPLRVCGYLNSDEKLACAQDPQRLPYIFNEVGFTAYNQTMLQQIRAFLATMPDSIDFQFDVFPDGSIGKTFAIDAHFEIGQPEEIIERFRTGDASQFMKLLQQEGVADDRCNLVPQAAFARSIPVKKEDGSDGKYAFVLTPNWLKVRWHDTALQPAKIYFLANASMLKGSAE